MQRETWDERQLACREDAQTALPADGGGAAARLRRRLPRFEDPGQRRALGNILRFLALVLVFTLVARGTAGATLARVQVVRPQRREVTQAVPVQAVVSAARSLAVEAPAGLKIRQMVAVPGQKLKVGDPVAYFEPHDVAEIRRRAELELEALRQKLVVLERDQPHDGTALEQAQSALQWAQEDVGTAQAGAQQTLAGAQGRVDAAQRELKAAQRAQDRLGDAASKEDKSAAKERLAAARAGVTAAEAALIEAQRTAAEGQQAAQRAEESARQGLASAQVQDAQARQQAADRRAEDSLTADGLLLDIARQEEALQLFAALGADGLLASGVEGVVIETAPEGAVTGEVSLAVVADAAGGYRAAGSLPQGRAQNLAPGAQAEVRDPQGRGQGAAPLAALLSLSEPDADGMVQALFRLPEGDWRQGQSLEVAVVESRETYDTCLPLGAVHTDQVGHFVYLVQVSSGVLGAQNTVVSQRVELKAQDGDYGALEGPLGPDDTVVLESTRPLAGGDRVRLEQP